MMLDSRSISLMMDRVAFFETHRRLPNFPKTHYLNDYLFEIKTTAENIDLRRRTTDKVEVRSYLADKLGADLSIPTLAVLDNQDEVESFVFPSDAMVKPTHLSGIVYRSGAGQPNDADRRRMKSWFETDYGRISNEANYRGLRPRIIVEPFLSLNGGYCCDVRIFVFRGIVTVIEVVGNRYHNPTIDFFTPDWKRSYYWRKNGCGHSDDLIPRPDRLKEMLTISREIGKDFSFIRVDCLTDFRDHLYICELTHISGNCRDRIEPLHADRFYVTGCREPAMDASGIPPNRRKIEDD